MPETFNAATVVYKTRHSHANPFAGQGAASTEADLDEHGFPDALDMGHLETAVRILAMLARGGCASFEERLNVLMQV